MPTSHWMWSLLSAREVYWGPGPWAAVGPDFSASLPGGVFMLWTEAGAESQAFSPRRGIWFLGWPSL